jgi:hypothetical protein
LVDQTEDLLDFLTCYSTKKETISMSNNMEDKEDVPCLLRFSGKQADWRMWSQKFKARTRVKKYLQIMTGVTKAPPAFILGTVETQEEEKER